MLPIQNLNGYDHPWAAGAGKNLLENTESTSTISGVTFTVNADGTVTANGTATADANKPVSINLPAGDYLVSGCADGGGTNKYNVYVWDTTSQSRPPQWDGVTPSITITDSTTMAQIKIESGHSYVVRLRVYSGYTASNIVFKPMICASTETDPTFAPYSNICPIYGHTAATAYRTGKNMLNVGNARTETVNGVTFTVDDEGAVTVNGTATATAFFFAASAVRFVNGTRYTLSGCPSGGGSSNYRGYIGGDTGAIYRNIIDVGEDASFTAVENTVQGYGIRIASGYTADNLVFRPMLRLASETDAAFAPYQGDTYTVSFGDTIYGGTLDFVTGVLTATWGYIASYNGETLPAEWISDRDAYAAGTTPTTGAEVAYRLATPQTYQLTPQEITTLLGTNNIWVTTTTNQP